MKRAREPQDHADIIRLWPKVEKFAADIEVKVVTARKMVLRRRIADRHWHMVESAARRRRITTPAGESVTVDLLGRLLALMTAAKRGRRVKNPPENPPVKRAA